MVPRFIVAHIREVAANARKKKAVVESEVARALFQQTQIEATEVKRRTPVDTGALRNSEYVDGPHRALDVYYCLIVAGGPAAPYALIVHENLDAHHDVGQAKYIESVILESAPYMADRISRQIDLNRDPSPISPTQTAHDTTPAPRKRDALGRFLPD